MKRGWIGTTRKEEKKRLLCWCCVVGEESDEEDEKFRFNFSKILKIKTFRIVFFLNLKK